MESLLREFRKKPLFEPGSLPHKPGTSEGKEAGRDEIEKIIPHRPPMLLIDTLTGIDVKEGLISGNRYIDPGDPVFRGHFPEFPVYPGVLEVEMIGQLGLCLYYFIANDTTAVEDHARPVDIRATRIMGAIYLEPLLPGAAAVVLAKSLDFDGFFGTAIGQVLSDGKVCCVAAGEVVFP
jgi:3-hydroxymyristoyl/3-hydroxydecanoyl-(acyl carrier protein) dehydratase